MAQALEAEEERLWKEQMQGAFQAADEARSRFRAAQEVSLCSLLTSAQCTLPLFDRDSGSPEYFASLLCGCTPGRHFRAQKPDAVTVWATMQCRNLLATSD